VWLFVGLMAFAQAKDEEFLLGDLGVKIDPAGWKMDRWSDSDFRATSTDGGVVLAAWATPLQVDLGEAAIWAPEFEEKITEFGAKKPQVDDAKIEQDAGHPVARLDLSFSFPDGAKGAAFGATMPIAGYDFHIATMARGTLSSRARSTLDSVVSKLEIRSPPLPIPEGPLTVGGHTIPVPEGFRKPLAPEADGVEADVHNIGGDDVSQCAWAIKPVALQRPWIFLVCPSRQHLGMVDELDVQDVAAEIAPHLFGKAEPPPVSLLALPDRNGLVWKLPMAGKGARMALIPTGTAAVRAWLVASSDSPDLDQQLQKALAAVTWAEPQVLTFGEKASYYTTYQPTSPQVVGPVVGLCCPAALLVGGVGMAFAARSRRKKRAAAELD
jgi:hypothetical protein